MRSTWWCVLGLCVLILLTSCRAGVLDPEKLVPPREPSAFPLDEFQAIRAPGGTGVFMVGAAAVDVSPYNYRVWISGFGAGKISRGVRDPIFARALFLDDGLESLVLLSLDLTGLPRKDIDQIRALATRTIPERILVGCTHNHLAPDTIGYWGFGPGIPLESGVLEPYQNELVHKAAEAIGKAVASARPGRLRFGTVTIPEGWSANLHFPDDPGAKDNEMGVIRAEDLAGQPVATLINWACHAEAMLGKGHRVSAEFPGQFYRAIESAGGGVGLFFPGAIGGMVIPYPNRWDQRRNFDFRARLAFNERLGALLAQKAQEALAQASSARDEPARIRLVRRTVEIPIEGKYVPLLGRMGIFRDAERTREIGNGRYVLDTEVYAVDLGPATIATVPGEAVPAIGQAIKARMRARHKFVFGLVSDELGYLLLPEQYRDRTYRYERMVSLGPEAGTRVQEAVLALLGRLETGE